MIPVPLRSGALPWRALRSPGYAALCTGAFISNVGTWMERIALGVYVAEVTRSSAWSGLTSALLFLPAVIGAPLGGSLGDRFDRKRYLRVVTTMQGLVALVITVLAYYDALNLPLLLILTALTGVSGTLLGPAFSALLTEQVPEDDVGSAIFLNSGQFNLARVLGPALGAWVLQVGGVTFAFALNTLSFFAVLVALRRVVPRARQRLSVESSVWSSVQEGIKAVRDEPGIAGALSVTLVAAVLISPFIGLIPIYALRELGASSSAASLLVTVQGIGAVLSALASSAYVGIFGYRRWVSGATFLLVPLSICYWLSPNLPYAVAFILLLGGAYLAMMAGCSSMTLTRAPPAMKARVASLCTGAVDVAYGLGVILLGSLGDIVGLRATCVCSAVGFGAYIYWLHKRQAPLFGRWDTPPRMPAIEPVVLADETP